MQSRMQCNPCAVALWYLVTVLSVGVVVPAGAVTLFTENFESYAPGSNLVGQGGWIEAWPSGGSVVTIANGTFLPTRVLDGRAATGLDQQNQVEHAITFTPSAVTTLLFQAYASSSAPITHNIAVMLDTFGPEIGSPSLVEWLPSANGPPHWIFAGPGFAGPGLAFEVPGGYDQVVTIGIVVDRVVNEIYGLYDFGGGLVQTPHYSVSETDIAAWDGLQLEVDHRNPGSYTGGEIDDIRIFDSTTDPDPPSPASSATWGRIKATYR